MSNDESGAADRSSARRDDELRAALRAEAAAHQPDREAMLSRITTAATSPDGAAPRRPTSRSGPRVRIAAAAAAVTALLAGGGVANWALTGDTDQDDAAPTPTPTVAVTTTAPTGSPSSAAPTSKPAEPTSRPAQIPTGRPSATPTRTPDRTDPAVRGPLRSAGSVDSGDSQGASVVTLRTEERLTRLEVVIRVARTDGLSSRGGTKQTPGASVTTTVTEEADTLVYRFVMSAADVLEPGTYTFSARYRHPAGGRDAGGDTYRATAATAGDAALDVHGDFDGTR